jgi:hypothetical protein
MTIKEQGIKDKSKYFIDKYGVMSIDIIVDIINALPYPINNKSYNSINFYHDIRVAIKTQMNEHLYNICRLGYDNELCNEEHIIFKTEIENKIYNVGVLLAFTFGSFSDLEFKKQIEKL